ncbi:hypothetical protein EGN72_01745 [Pseudorhodobacter sp. E13]|nr:hypothetical protein EGN72_01745 [Pseudorhodobacter sp. E13]
MSFRPFALVLLCLALVASSVTMAVARGQALALSRGGTTLVICSGYGVTTLSLDAGGNPIGPVHPCPDCLAGLAAYIPPAAVQPVVVAQLAGQIKRVKAAPLPHLFHVLQTRARGPPVLV